MIFFPWTEEHSVGVAGFDNEHWQLMTLINQLYDSLLTGAVSAKLIDIIDGVRNYAGLHLKHEDDAMTWAHYPETEAHLQFHAEFRRTMTKFRQQAEKAWGTPAVIDVGRDLANYLKSWLENHIHTEDKKLGHYLNAKGIR